MNKLLVLFLMISFSAKAEVGIPVEELTEDYSVRYIVMCYSENVQDYVQAAGEFNTREEADEYISHDSRDCYVDEQ